MLLKGLRVAVEEPECMKSLGGEVVVGEDEAAVREGGQVNEDSRVDSTSNRGDGGGGRGGLWCEEGCRAVLGVMVVCEIFALLPRWLWLPVL